MKATIYSKASTSLLAYAGIIDKNTLLAVELAKVSKAYQSGNVAVAIDTVIMLSNGKIETTRDKKGAVKLDALVKDFATKQKNKFIVGVLCLAIVEACEMSQDDILSKQWAGQCNIQVAEFKAIFGATKPAKVVATVVDALPLAVVSHDLVPLTLTDSSMHALTSSVNHILSMSGNLTDDQCQALEDMLEARFVALQSLERALAEEEVTA